MRLIPTGLRLFCHEPAFPKMDELGKFLYGNLKGTEGICILPGSPFRFPALFYSLDAHLYRGIHHSQ